MRRDESFQALVIKLEKDVDPYDFCAGMPPIGAVVTEVNAAIPEEEE